MKTTKSRLFPMLFILMLSCISEAQDSHHHGEYEITNFNQRSVFGNGENLKRANDDGLEFARAKHTNLQGNSILEQANHFLLSRWEELKHEQTLDEILELVHVDEHKASSVVRFHQFFEGIQVKDARIVLSFSNETDQVLVSNTSWPIDPDFDISVRLTTEQVKESISKHFKNSDRLQMSDEGLFILIKDNLPILTWHWNVRLSDSGTTWSLFINAKNGEIIQSTSNEVHVHGKGTVFSPSPTWSARRSYGGAYSNGNDASNPTLEAQMKTVTLLDIEEDGGVYRLKGPFAEIDDDNDKYASTSDDFSTTRDNDLFEAVSCYYHIDRTLRYAQNDLGYSITSNFADGVLKLILV